MSTAFVYCRVSTREQTEGVSLEVQEAECRTWADTNGHAVELFVDAGWSGKRFDRPALTGMLSRLAETHVIVVWKLDRLARDNVDRGLIVRELRRHDVELVSVTQPELTGDSPESHLVAGVLGAVAEFESALIGARVRAGQRRRAEQGKRWQKAPYGYDKDWRPVPDHVEVIELIDSLYLAGYGTVRIAQRLNADGYRTATGRGQWWQGSVRDILIRGIYSGVEQWGKRIRHGTTTTPRPEDEWVEVEVDIPIIRPVERWERIKVQMTERTVTTRTGPSDAVFAGLLWCGCGSRMSAYSWTRAAGETVRAYRCSLRYAGGICTYGGTRIREADLLDAVTAEAAVFVAGGPLITPHQPDREKLEGRLNALNTRRRRAREAYLAGRLEVDEFDEETEIYRTQRERLERALKDADAETPIPLDPAAAARLLAVPSRGDAARAWARDVIERLEWDAETLAVDWKL